MARDFTRAAEPFRRTVEIGHADGQIYLGHMLVEGVSVEHNIAEAWL